MLAFRQPTSSTPLHFWLELQADWASSRLEKTSPRTFFPLQCLCVFWYPLNGDEIIIIQKVYPTKNLVLLQVWYYQNAYRFLCTRHWYNSKCRNREQTMCGISVHSSYKRSWLIKHVNLIEMNCERKNIRMARERRLLNKSHTRTGFIVAGF